MIEDGRAAPAMIPSPGARDPAWPAQALLDPPVGRRHNPPDPGDLRRRASHSPPGSSARDWKSIGPRAAQFNGMVSGRPASAWGKATARTGPPDTTFFISRRPVSPPAPAEPGERRTTDTDHFTDGPPRVTAMAEVDGTTGLGFPQPVFLPIDQGPQSLPDSYQGECDEPTDLHSHGTADGNRRCGCSRRRAAEGPQARRGIRLPAGPSHGPL